MKETRLKRLLVYKAMKLWCKSLVSTKYQQNKIRYENVLLLLAGRAAKPDPVFWVQPNFGLNFWVQTGWVGPQDPKVGPIRSGWPQKGFKFGFNSKMYFKNPILTQHDPFLCWVGPWGFKIGLRRVGLALRIKIWVRLVGVHLAALIQNKLWQPIENEYEMFW